jgi:hypothetical protein
MSWFDITVIRFDVDELCQALKLVNHVNVDLSELGFELGELCLVVYLSELGFDDSEVSFELNEHCSILTKMNSVIL